MRPLLLRSRWALPIESPVLENSALLIGPDGRIAGLGPSAEIDPPEGAEILDLGDAILLPGLVNTHTHLELTGLAPLSSLPKDPAASRPADFPLWIQDLRALKESRSPEEYLDAARAGLLECWAGGVTTIADTGDSGAVLRVLAELGGSGIAYQEVFGPHPAQLDRSLSGLRSLIAESRPYAGGRVVLGVSPHAPYTVSGPLFARVAEWAAREALPLAVHVA